MNENDLPNNATRYTVMICSNPQELEGKIAACNELSLEWFCRGLGSRIQLHVFFDTAGVRNYLLGLYEDDEELER